MSARNAPVGGVPLGFARRTAFSIVSARWLESAHSRTIQFMVFSIISRVHDRKLTQKVPSSSVTLLILNKHFLNDLSDCAICLLCSLLCNQIGARGPWSFNNTAVVVHTTAPGERVRLTCATRCIRFSCAMSGATQMSTGSIECSLAHSREAM
jgi:hypothetical protein